MDINENTFKDFLRKKSKKEGWKPEDYFTIWYLKQRFGDKSKWKYTDGQDGGVDALVEKNGNLTIIQTTTSNIKTGSVDRFKSAVRAFEGKTKKFQDWLDHEVTKKDDKKIFRKYYLKHRRNRKEYHLVVFSKKNKNIESRLKEFKGKVIYYHSQDLLNLYKLYVIGVRESPALHIHTDKSTLEFHGNYQTQFLTRVFVMKLKPFLNYLKSHSESELIFGRNVRVHQDATEVNVEMKSTWTDNPGLFFYGNNGIHIICNTCVRDSKGNYKLTNPQIINGSQTLHTLKEVEKSQEGYILTRVTIIPKNYQTKQNTQKMIDKIIHYSNSNNVMKESDLRSNDEIQVKLARELISKNIFYERKTNEWQQEKQHHTPNTMHINSIDLAKIMMVCDKNYGPVHYKKFGSAPLFRSPGRRNTEAKKGHYPEQFKMAFSSMDETETKIRLSLFISKAIRDVKRSKKTKTVPNASKNFLLYILWKYIRGTRINHPIKIQNFRFRNKKLKKLVIYLGDVIVKDYAKMNRKENISVNDYFRNEDVMKRILLIIRKSNFESKVKPALKEILKTAK